MASVNQGNGFLSGLKKLLFQDEHVTIPPAEAVGPSSMEVPASSQVTGPEFSTAGSTSDIDVQQMQAKANQLLESINQPGVDFLEVWNAAVENGGANAATVKSAFNTLRYADKTLNKEKVLSTGRFYTGKLQEAIDTDVQRKGAKLKQLEEEKEQRRAALDQEARSLEQQVAELQKNLAEKQTLQARLDEDYTKPIADIRQTIIIGQNTVTAMIAQMNEMIQLAEREL